MRFDVGINLLFHLVSCFRIVTSQCSFARESQIQGSPSFHPSLSWEYHFLRCDVKEKRRKISRVNSWQTTLVIMPTFLASMAPAWNLKVLPDKNIRTSPSAA
jgi:hypothetical protein